jgi:hypothetical protein
MARRKSTPTPLDLRGNAMCIAYTHRMRAKEAERRTEEEFNAVVEELAQKPDTLAIRDTDTGTTTLLHIPLHVRVFYAEMFNDNEEEDRIREALPQAIVLRITDET